MEPTAPSENIISPELIEKYSNFRLPPPPVTDYTYDDRIPGLALAEDIFDTLGLMRGEGAPLKRFIFGFLLTGVVLAYIEPNLTHHNGMPRGWKVIDKDASSTYFPWYVLAASAGIIVSVFI